MNYKKLNNYIILSLQNGDYINESIEAIFVKEKLKSGWVTGLGAIYDVELGCYDLTKKKYKKKRFSGEYELTSLTGNITFVKGQYFVHTHITICDNNFKGFGGHLFDAKISAAGDCILQLYYEQITRKMNHEIGLSLWCLEEKIE